MMKADMHEHCRRRRALHGPESASQQTHIIKADSHVKAEGRACTFTFLGAFAKLRKATISFVMSVCLSAEQLGSHWTDFYEVSFASIIRKFNDHGSVHREYIPIYIQEDATLNSLFISGNCSTCFVWYFQPSSGEHTTVSTSSGICHTLTAICRYGGRVGTGLSVLWVAYATHSTLKPVPTLPR
jgi:hypothetical protein